MKRLTHKLVVFWVFMALMLLTVALTSCELPDDDDCDDGADLTLVDTQNGLLRGQYTDDGAVEFLGIPYAKPPVGNLRWKAPQDPDNWEGEREATGFCSTCPQAETPFGAGSVNEDCLYLNVTTPSICGSKPVMVWIHGGAFVTGSGSEDGYDPTRLVQEDVVVVTLNYRLGALGFLPLEELADANGEAGNWGVMDQQKALQWVKNNIAGFGGDPDNVTIFGESAGGHSVYTHLASPASAGLFHKAISQSGAYFITQPSITDGRAITAEPFLADANLTSEGAQLVSDLYAMDVASILAAQGDAMYVPVTGTPVLPRSVFDAVSAGEYNNVPVISGCNLNEGRLFTALEVAGGNTISTEEAYLASVNALIAQFPMEIDVDDVATTYIEMQDPADANKYRLAYSQIFTDVMFATTNFFMWTSLDTVYAYWFTDTNAPSLFNIPALDFYMEASHMDEIQYVFGTVAHREGVTDAQKALSEEMVGYWTRFAKQGAPAASSWGSSSWTTFEPGFLGLGLNGRVKKLDTPTSNTNGSEFINAHNCQYWAELLM